jgi:rsbT antagonist protein RsbS
VVASIQVDLTEDVLRQFRIDLLEMLHESGAGGVVLDLAGVDIMDLEDFEAIRQTLAMATLLGAHTILAGLRPGVVSSLVELDANVEDIRASLNLDLAFEQIHEILSNSGDQVEPELADDRDDEANSCAE